MNIKLDAYGIGMLVIVFLVVVLVGLYAIVPQVQKVVDVPLADDERDPNPINQGKEDADEIGMTLSDKYGIGDWDRDGKSGEVLDWDGDGDVFDWDNDGDSVEWWPW